MILHSDREGNDCIRKLRCHCIQILHLDIYSAGYTPYTVSNSRNPTTVFVLFTVNFTPSSKTQAKPKREIMESNEL